MPTNERPGAGAPPDSAGLMQSIQRQATSALSTQKDRAADGITAVIEAVRHTGDQLREKNGTIAGYADSAVGQLERWSSQLRDRDVSELIDDVGAFARRRPAVFVGGGVALGLLAARFLKSSSTGAMPRAQGQTPQQMTTSASRRSMESGSLGSMESMSTTFDSAATGIAADRSSSQTPRPPRPRSRPGDGR
jgi:hypothetical protein